MTPSLQVDAAGCDPGDYSFTLVFTAATNEVAYALDEESADEAAALLAAPIEAYYAAYLDSRKGAAL